MVHCDFSNSLYKYLDIYHNGLKNLQKQRNASNRWSSKRNVRRKSR